MSDLQDTIANAGIKAFNSGYLAGAYDERLRIIDLIRITYTDSKHEEWGSLEWTQDIIKLIQGEP